MRDCAHTRAFDAAMRREASFEQEEREANERNDHPGQASAHEQRIRYLDGALHALELCDCEPIEASHGEHTLDDGLRADCKLCIEGERAESVALFETDTHTDTEKGS